MVNNRWRNLIWEKLLKYRQQIIYENKNLTIINDSKSTSFASSENLLKNLKNVYWILGGIPKKGDQFNLSKKHCKNFKTFIFGNNYKDFKIGNFQQLLPFHYVEKDWLTAKMIKQMEQDYGI